MTRSNRIVMNYSEIHLEEARKNESILTLAGVPHHLNRCCICNVRMGIKRYVIILVEDFPLCLNCKIKMK
jgi:hypothetical protein